MTRRPLVAHHGALGDTIHLTAMARALALRWGAPCDVLAGPPTAPALLAGLEFIGEVRCLGPRARPYFTSPLQWELVRWLRARAPAPCYVMERWRHRRVPWSPHTRLEWLLRRAGIPAERMVTASGAGREPLEHGVDYMLRVAAREPTAFAGGAIAAIPQPPPRPELRAGPAEVEACRSWLRKIGWRGEPLVLLQTAARRPRKRGIWPQQCWLEVIRGLRCDLPAAWILLMGVERERPQTQALAAATADSRVCTVAGELPLRRLLALLTLAHSCLSLDTGPAQAAAALDCPLVVLAGSADPRRNGPLGPPERVQVVTAYGAAEWPDSPVEWFERHRLADIPQESVLAAWRRLSPRAG